MEHSTFYIGNIQRFSLDDGPGIRTTVFVKGCNLACLWCHNPENITFKPSLQFVVGSCSLCRNCEAVCPNKVHTFENGIHKIDRKKCTLCGKCVEACNAGALTLIGKPCDKEELLTILKKDMPYYKTSKGGVTFSGGEPMLFAEYLLPILEECKKEGFHIAIDTAGNVPYENFEKILPFADLFLFDVKLFDCEKHQKATGVSNKRILENLRRLSEEGTEIFIRVPVIPGINDALEEMEKISAFLAPLKNISLVQLLPYHSYGVGKYQALGLLNPLGELIPPDDSFMEKARKLFTDKNINASVS